MKEYIRVSGLSIHSSYGMKDEDLINLINLQWQAFHASHGHYPSSQEIDTCPEMVTTRTIQRRLGGLMELRKRLGHEITNYSAGETRSKTASLFIARSLDEEYELLRWLIGKFGNKPNIASQDPYNEFETKYRSDYGVYHKTGHFFVDIFSAKDVISMAGSINSKQRKIEKSKTSDIIYLVSTNPNITQDQIDTLVKNKKNPLPKNVIAITLDGFKSECEKYIPNVL